MDPLLKKMKFVPTARIVVAGAPPIFPVTSLFQEMGQRFATTLDGLYDWMVVCVMNTADVATVIPRAMQSLSPEGLLWICYPKRGGRYKTDLSRDHGWEAIQGIGLKHVNLISVDEDWTAWGVILGTDEINAKSQKKSDARNELLAQYMDHKTREMWYPPAMQAILDAHPQQKEFFLQLSFTNRKEYLEWIVSAKRAETQQERLGKMIEYLKTHRKNPAGR
jgi:hypothetical protein